MWALGGDTNNRSGEVPKAPQGEAIVSTGTMLTGICIGPERPALRGKSHRAGLGARGIFNEGLPRYEDYMHDFVTIIHDRHSYF